MPIQINEGDGGNFLDVHVSGILSQADESFHRQWALTLLDLTLNRLEAEFMTAGKPGEFEVLKCCLMAEHGAIDFASRNVGWLE